MLGEFEKDIEAGTERGRSPSAVPDSAAGDEALEPQPNGAEWVDEEPVNPPERESAGSAATIPEDPESPEFNIPDEPGAEVLDEPVRLPHLTSHRRGRRLVKPKDLSPKQLTPEQRLLLLDTWSRSGLPASDFSSLVGVSKLTLYNWKKRFEAEGPGGLMDRARGLKGSRLPEVTKRAILLMKETHPDWGSQRISDMLYRGPALPASPGAVLRVLHEAGYVLEESPTRPHPEKQVRSFERARPNQLWQSDLFTFLLKRQNRRLYLVAYLDDHSRFVVGYGLHATQSAALVIEVLRAAIASYQAPEELLTDNGSQYVTWRGKSAFQRELERRGIRHLVSSPRHPQTLGKTERFWGSLWRECLEAAIFLDLEDARRRIGLYIDYYNFLRAHQGIGGLVPADRFFGAAPEVLRTLKERVAANSLELARDGLPRPPFYLTGQVGGRSFSVHAEGERVILTRGEGRREEVELVPPAADGTDGEAVKLPEPVCTAGEIPGAPLGGDGAGGAQAPGTSPLDGSFDLRAGEPGVEEPREGGGEEVAR